MTPDRLRGFRNSSRRWPATFLIIAAVAGGGAGPRGSSAAEPATRAVTQAAEADADFPLQGEYAGNLRVPGVSRYYGLQVVALGDGRFDAALLVGGLPGNGWDQQGRYDLKGQRSGQGARCESIDFVVLVDGRSATVSDRQGRDLGVLRRVVRESPTLGTPAPPGAVVLFDGHTSDEIQGAEVTPDGCLQVGGLTRRTVRDFRLHLEFAVPYMPAARGQGRGNSGVYIQQRYEVQILDSFGLVSADNDCAAVYRQQKPDVNVCFPPLTWQTYDIVFHAARWDADGNKLSSARLTVLHNGVPVHQERILAGKTGAGQPEGPEPRPILLQNHGDPVRFRNIWLVELDEPAGCICRERGGGLKRLLTCGRR